MRSTIQRWYLCLWLGGLIVAQGGSAAAIGLVSERSTSFSTNLGGDGDSGGAIMSPNGRFVLFASAANNLTLTNNNLDVVPQRFNVFCRDTLLGTTTLVSVNQAGTGGGNADSFPTGISTNGQFALFESSATDLAANLTNSATNIFVRDLVGGTTILANVSTSGVIANGTSRGSVITPNGRYVAFASTATNLARADTNNIADVFVRDLQAGTTVLASVGAVSNAAPSTAYSVSSSESPEITPDGRYVAFYSTATNLVPGVTTSGEVYVRDLIAGNTIWASTNAHGVFKSTFRTTNVISCNYSISDDGRFVGFEACSNTAGPLAGGIILRYGLQTGLTDVICTNARVQSFSYELIHNLAMTPDGNSVAYVAYDSPSDAIDVWNAETASNVLASVVLGSTNLASGIFDWPVVSANGQYVAFVGSASNLAANSTAGELHVYWRDLEAGVTQLLDTDANGNGVGVDSLTVPSMSADGSRVAFASANLLADNRHLVHDLFARNVPAGTTSLISAANPTLVAQTPDGLSGYGSFSVSSNGQFVAFYSEADNLVPNDTNGGRDVFVRDLVAGTNYLVSVNVTGTSSGDDLSTDPSISGSGRYVAFTSAADNLVAGDNNQAQDVFVRDLQAGTTTLVSVNTGGVNPGNNNSYTPSISSNGRYVLFHSKASNVAAGSFGTGIENLFLRDLQAGVTYPLTSSGVSSGAMTPDGHYVAFAGAKIGTTASEIYVWNSASNAFAYTNNTVIEGNLAISQDGQTLAYVAGTASLGRLFTLNWATNSPRTAVPTTIATGVFQSHAGPTFNASGRFLAYAMATNAMANQQTVYRYDRQSGTNLQISQYLNPMVITNGVADSPALSPDGRFVAYRSSLPNIAPFATNNVLEMFVYDTSNNATILASVSTAGNAAADDRSFKPLFSPDGQTFYFESWAANISSGDFNNGSDLFALSVGALPLITGSGGSTNPVSGFLAQWNSAGAYGSGPSLSWPLAAGESYQVQYKTNLTDAVWLNLPNSVAYLGTNAYLGGLSLSTGQRFYRIVANP